MLHRKIQQPQPVPAVRRAGAGAARVAPRPQRRVLRPRTRRTPSRRATRPGRPPKTRPDPTKAPDRPPTRVSPTGRPATGLHGRATAGAGREAGVQDRARPIAPTALKTRNRAPTPATGPVPRSRRPRSRWWRHATAGRASRQRAGAASAGPVAGPDWST